MFFLNNPKWHLSSFKRNILVLFMYYRMKLEKNMRNFFALLSHVLKNVANNQIHFFSIATKEIRNFHWLIRVRDFRPHFFNIFRSFFQTVFWIKKKTFWAFFWIFLQNPFWALSFSATFTTVKMMAAKNWAKKNHEKSNFEKSEMFEWIVLSSNDV